MPLQRTVTDFGADVSFESASKKMKEHYAIELPSSTIRLIVEKHAKNMERDQAVFKAKKITKNPPQFVVTETDGSMIPIVTFDSKIKGDKRKTRKTLWREARLSLARQKGSKTTFYRATLGSPDEVGNQLADIVQEADRGPETRIHALGDGAPWIAEQVEKVFGDDATYLIDFYHLSQYLNEASQCCFPTNPISWFHEQQKLMKENELDCVLKNLKNHLDDEKIPKHQCGAQKCYQYMIKRTNQFNYKSALNRDLPIGSGEIEGAHRTVVQKRLKISGGWWLEENAQSMLAMRTTRANNHWDSYWAAYKAHELSNHHF